MRGRDDRGEGMFSYIRLEDRVPADHPLRAIRVLTDEVLAALDGRFEGMYSAMGRPSIAPEMLLRAMLLQAFFSVRSERQLMEQIDYNLLFRWFVGLPIDAAIWHPTVFSHNRDRLMAADVSREFLGALMGLAQVKALLSSEHFSVDGTLIDAWASMKSFQPGPAPDLIRGTGRGHHPQAPDAMASATFMGKSARMIPIPARPTPMHGFTRSRTASRAGFATWAMY
jgi:transposase